MALSHGIPNELVKAILALMSADNSDDMATLWGNARIAFEQAIADARAAGYAEAIEKATAAADEIERRMMDGARNAEEICDKPKAAEVMKHFAEGAWKVGRAIRALAPATTKESK